MIGGMVSESCAMAEISFSAVQSSGSILGSQSFKKCGNRQRIAALLKTVLQVQCYGKSADNSCILKGRHNSDLSLFTQIT
jgi:hypothetical protein